jgi:hypothetical protein
MVVEKSVLQKVVFPKQVNTATFHRLGKQYLVQIRLHAC